ncbi:VanZ family protein [Virgibacillus indicus]|uniref:VanZ family protein n=1 Tax=Virgibacillus indicus TaxID=2024554 RepID=A0A265NAH6_9BACI|nr:VanZ family protein [Virgibacillus indicus]OZU88811.1 VanZ family protein [Virgibacillus indicus]
MRKYLYWLMPLIWMGVIFYSSHQPYEKQNIKPLLSNMIDLSFLEPFLSWISFTYHNSPVSVETHGVEGFIEFFIRKGAHIGVFFILCLLFYAALRKSAAVTFWTTLFISFFLTVAYAILDEIHQGFTPNRTPYIGDVFLDSFGGILAVACLLVLHWWKRKKTNAPKK